MEKQYYGLNGKEKNIPKRMRKKSDGLMQARTGGGINVICKKKHKGVFR